MSKQNKRKEKRKVNLIQSSYEVTRIDMTPYIPKLEAKRIDFNKQKIWNVATGEEVKLKKNQGK